VENAVESKATPALETVMGLAVVNMAIGKGIVENEQHVRLNRTD
jgi:hypothetical protein